ncbi:MAG: microcin C ABC transporter permease YejB [Candidatus Portiera sp.]|nr:microcin C ABC transporter permease YejB [Portiera sp.]
MTGYILRRLLLIIPTLLGIMIINFALVQGAPGGPIEQTLAQLTFENADATSQFSNALQFNNECLGSYCGSQGLEQEFIDELRVLYGFDKPPLQRFFLMLKSYITFDFGESFFKGRKVTSLIWETLPVSISLGLWSTLLVYFLSIPLGIAKAVRNGSKFDAWSSMAVIIGYAIPGFLLAIIMLIVFAGGSFWQIFPLSGLVSDNFSELSWWRKILDYLWHITLPTITLSIGGFAALTILTKNAFLEEINKKYAWTALCKGLSFREVLYKHIFRNAMLLIIAGVPALLVGVFLTGSLLIEIIFSLNGLGLLGFEAIVNRDYPVVFASLYIFTLLGLLLKIVSDITYTIIDPRINFESNE